jgi:hypothetical protein
VDILTESRERASHKKIIPLFQTNNTCLQKTFENDRESVEYIFDKLDRIRDSSASDSASPSASVRFGIATLSRLLSRAADLWPDGILELFRASNKIYPAIIRNLGDRLVFQTAFDLITENHVGMVEFFWYVFQGLRGGSPWAKKMPWKCFGLRALDIAVPFSNEQTENALDLMRQFFAQEFNEVTDFRDIVCEWIEGIDENDLIPNHFELAKVLRYSVNLMKKAVALTGMNGSVKVETADGRKRKRESGINGPKLLSAISYLGCCPSKLARSKDVADPDLVKALVKDLVKDLGTAVEKIFENHVKNRPAELSVQFVLLGVTNMVKDIDQGWNDNDAKSEFRSKVRFVIKEFWNWVLVDIRNKLEREEGAKKAKVESSGKLKLATCLEIASLIYEEGKTVWGEKFEKNLQVWKSLQGNGEEMVKVEEEIDYEAQAELVEGDKESKDE